MNWTTLYIEGKPGFDSEVLKCLEHSGFTFMHGTSLESGVCLYWVDEKAKLRDFKQAIGSKTVFKYRLRFYGSIEELMEAKPQVEEAEDEIPLPDLAVYA
jgi:hypothetical protein